jgi:hypothetical protein
MEIMPVTKNGEFYGWYDADKASFFVETNTSGISDSTSTRVNHECLILTDKGTWLINYYSEFAECGESIEAVSQKEAVNFLLKNGYNIKENAKLPATAKKQLLKEVSKLEV